MSQEQNEQPRRTRRITRAQRNRPVLVTNDDTGVALDTKQTDESTITDPSTDKVAVGAIEATRETGPRRRLGFFSTIGKSAEDSEKKETDVTQARLARAMRGKTTKSITAKVEVPQKEASTEEKKPARPTASRTPERPASAFKTRYIIGMGVYLLAANFLGTYEIQFMRNMHADTVLTTFDLFGGKVVISSSTLVFLATLIIILVLLARLDLIPRSLTGASRTQTGKASQEKASQSGEPAPRYTPPPVRQGVKGSDDELYQAYRANLRREKKK
jgi:hypothetical protein